jgi:hypothetical protein
MGAFQTTHNQSDLIAPHLDSVYARLNLSESDYFGLWSFDRQTMRL